MYHTDYGILKIRTLNEEWVANGADYLANVGLDENTDQADMPALFSQALNGHRGDWLEDNATAIARWVNRTVESFTGAEAEFCDEDRVYEAMADYNYDVEAAVNDIVEVLLDSVEISNEEYGWTVTW